jgi:hypothetical protein
MTGEFLPQLPRSGTRGWLRPAVAITTVVFACAVYANLSLMVTHRAYYRYFPPFQPFVDANRNKELGGEYFCIAKSLMAGEGFASPFKEPTGPTAWMPPVLPVVLAGLLWLCGGSQNAVMACVVMLQVYTIIGTGLLVLVLARRYASRLGAGLIAAIFLAAVLGDFRHWFQQTHDCWLILAVMNVLIAWLYFGRPLGRRRSAFIFGLFGGLCTLTHPILGLAWGVLAFAGARRPRGWGNLGLAVLSAALVVTPWMVRNYLVFGRLIPVKSNIAYELYQTQCLQPDALLRGSTFGAHPYVSAGRERLEYKGVGEMEFLDHKLEIFMAAVRTDPLDFCQRVGVRALGATVWYVPLDRTDRVKRPWVVWMSRVMFPLPFLSILVLVGTAAVRPLGRIQWLVIALYFLYLLPYIVISYYVRYEMPLLGVKVLLVVWALDRLLPRRCERLLEMAEVTPDSAAVRGPRSQKALAVPKLATD